MDVNLPERIVTEIVLIGYEGYQFEINNERIIRYGRRSTQESCGLLVKNHYQEVAGILYIIHLLKDGKTKESIAAFYIGEKEQKEYEKAPTLAKCLDALKRQLSLLMDGAYDAYYDDCHKRHDGESSSERFDLPYEMEMQDIFWHMLDLQEGKVYKSGNIKYEGKRGIPKIETTGERLYAEALNLFWKMDNGPDYISPEEQEARRIQNEYMKRIIPVVPDM